MGDEGEKTVNECQDSGLPNRVDVQPPTVTWNTAKHAEREMWEVTAMRKCQVGTPVWGILD